MNAIKLYPIETYPTDGSLVEKFEWIENINPDNLLNREKFGEIFLPAAQSFEKVQLYLNQIGASKLDETQRRWNINLIKPLDVIANAVSQIIDPNLQPVNAGQIAQQNLEQF